ncbi:MAG TPA: OpgC domain-containing protein [Steroidobacteraceae bacterium]|nr:OpgC domain-containing protein [Steroidobacteraceae bacterium]
MSISPAPSASRRRDELDVLRGLLLVMMVLTHLPTRLNVYANQTFGFISAAEGFVFLSAFLIGSIYSRQLIERGVGYVRSRLWKRAGRLYLMHLGLLVFLFTVVAALAVMTDNHALRNHLRLYFDSPVRASIAGPLLLYQPPLLDILPMYIVFLLATPALLKLAARRGWRLLVACSVLLWAFAQLGGRSFLYGKLSLLLGSKVPLDAFGAFDWFAWQLVWIAGLWLGARQLRRTQPTLAGADVRGMAAAGRAPRTLRSSLRQALVGRGLLMTLALATTVLFLLYRYEYLSLPFAPATTFALTDKWHLGALRIVNFAALAYVVNAVVLPVFAWLRMTVLSMLGRASLEVFTAHVPFCVLSRALLVDDATPLPFVTEVLLLGATFGVMIFIAWRTGLVRAPPLRRAAAAA